LCELSIRFRYQDASWFVFDAANWALGGGGNSREVLNFAKLQALKIQQQSSLTEGPMTPLACLVPQKKVSVQLQSLPPVQFSTCQPQVPRMQSFDVKLEGLCQPTQWEDLRQEPCEFVASPQPQTQVASALDLQLPLLFLSDINIDIPDPISTTSSPTNEYEYTPRQEAFEPADFLDFDFNPDSEEGYSTDSGTSQQSSPCHEEDTSSGYYYYFTSNTSIPPPSCSHSTAPLVPFFGAFPTDINIEEVQDSFGCPASFFNTTEHFMRHKYRYTRSDIDYE